MNRFMQVFNGGYYHVRTSNKHLQVSQSVRIVQNLSALENTLNKSIVYQIKLEE